MHDYYATNARRGATSFATLFVILMAILVLGLTGCATGPDKLGKLNETLKAIDALGLKRVSIPGRVTFTEYVREGKTSTLTHTNPALAGPIVIMRERTEAGE
jgi:hypothetical protein